MRRPILPPLIAGALLAAVLGSAAAARELGPPKRPGEWGQAVSDLKPEADIRFGRLPNGMRYALLRNATPAHQISLRLRIGSGSLDETDGQEGLAHFLEHMAFKGSTHVPGGELLHTLQRLGLSFGADTNAFTAFDQTVFMFDLPENDPKSIDTGLMLMREIGGELTLAQDAMDAERGVVLSEERLRDTPEYEAQKAGFGFTLDGQRAPQRWPIGLNAVLQTAPVSRVRAFYDAWYRPQNATLVAVGDFDLDAMEAKIKARFADWAGRGIAPPPPDLGKVASRDERVKLFVRPGAPEGVSLSWVDPYDPTADTAARERRDTIESLGLAVLNRRLDVLARSGNPPFTRAESGRDNTLRSARITTLQVGVKPGGWAAGLEAATAEVRRLLRYGVTAAELGRETVDRRTALQALAQQEATRRTPALANDIVDAVNDDEVFTGPAQNLANFDRYVAGLTPAQVDAALHAAFAGAGPLAFVTTPVAVPGGEGAVKAALDQALVRPVMPPVARSARRWPYASFGPAGRIAERRDVVDLGITRARFANGVKLTVKPTTYAKGQVLVEVRVGRGRLDLPRGRASPTWLAHALTLGGTRELTAEEIEQDLNDRVVSAAFGVGDDAFAFTATTRPQDLDVQMQLLAAYVSRPGFRPQAEARVRAMLAEALPQIDATPEGVLARGLGGPLHGGDLRFQPLPDAAGLAASRDGDLARLVARAFAEGEIAVTVVGDVTPQAAEAAVAATFGALPARPAAAAEPAGARTVRFPPPVAAPLALVHHGRADQAVAYVAWPIRGFYADPAEARTAQVAAQVFENRLVEQVRIAEGATYSPGAEASPSQVFPDYGVFSAQVETPPAKIDGFYADVAHIAADLAARPPTPDELARAKAPLLEGILKARQTNGWWLHVLSLAQGEPRELEAIRTQEAQVRAVGPEEVRRVAERDLAPARAWRLVVRAPQPAPGAPEQTPIAARPAPKPLPPVQPSVPASPNPGAPPPPTTPPGAAPPA